ncbi:MAG TPA: hypothetical protein VLA98_13430 [Solirubrobacteraceae bacterium]|nr:hypothetical protein [Solirubrobacteraceae bacterium]HSD79163.1 hypothetical protein [Solirubrobacteraceae bacterium]
MAKHISIGFQASPPLALRVSEGELERLEAALGRDGWHEIHGEDGDVRLSLQHVLWLRVEREEHRVGFGLT